MLNPAPVPVLKSLLHLPLVRPILALLPAVAQLSLNPVAHLPVVHLPVVVQRSLNPPALPARPALPNPVVPPSLLQLLPAMPSQLPNLVRPLLPLQRLLLRPRAPQRLGDPRGRVAGKEAAKVVILAPLRLLRLRPLGLLLRLLVVGLISLSKRSRVYFFGLVFGYLVFFPLDGGYDEKEGYACHYL
ncbi:hypothetical protein C8J56DRAFT_936380 [Mycena floridula]|nr:hypothetical protein C8J56DRAFT_936380 [Mycena floridula]